MSSTITPWDVLLRGPACGCSGLWDAWDGQAAYSRGGPCPWLPVYPFSSVGQRNYGRCECVWYVCVCVLHRKNLTLEAAGGETNTSEQKERTYLPVSSWKVPCKEFFTLLGALFCPVQQRFDQNGVRPPSLHLGPAKAQYVGD